MPPFSVKDLGGDEGAVSPHHPQSQTTQHWQSGDRYRKSSSGMMGTAKPGESPLSLSYSTTGLVFSSTAHSHRQADLLREAGRAHGAFLEKQAMHAGAELSSGSFVWPSAFQGRSSLGFYGYCPGKSCLPAQFPAAVEGGVRTSEGPATQLPLQRQTTAP